MRPEVTAMWGSHKITMPTKDTALPGRAERMPVPAKHHVHARPLTPPFPAGLQTAVFGLGCFWGAEKAFWQTPGVFTTAVGYAGGVTPNPTYEEVCTGSTGHNEVVLVVFDPTVISYEGLLKVFWEAHDPTQGMRQGNDVGTQYRSGIYVFSPEQRRVRRGRGGARPGGRRAGADRATRRPEGADGTGGPPHRRGGRERARGDVVQHRQELPGRARRRRRRARSDPRHRRSRVRLRNRRRVRLAAESADHVAAAAPADERVVGDDVRQAGHDRPQSRPRQGRLRTDGQGRAASD